MDDSIDLVVDLLQLNPQVNRDDFRRTVITLRNLILAQNPDLTQRAKQKIAEKQAQIEAESIKKAEDEAVLKSLCQKLFFECFDVQMNGRKVETFENLRYHDELSDIDFQIPFPFERIDMRGSIDPRTDLEGYLLELKKRFDGDMHRFTLRRPSKFEREGFVIRVVDGKPEPEPPETFEVLVTIRWKHFLDLDRIKKLLRSECNTKEKG